MSPWSAEPSAVWYKKAWMQESKGVHREISWDSFVSPPFIFWWCFYLQFFFPSSCCCDLWYAWKTDMLAMCFWKLRLAIEGGMFVSSMFNYKCSGERHMIFQLSNAIGPSKAHPLSCYGWCFLGFLDILDNKCTNCIPLCSLDWHSLLALLHGLF